MSELSLNEQSFISKCSDSKDALLDLIESYHRSAAFGINNNQSVFQAEAVDTLGRAYCLLYNTIIRAVTTMSIDWNIIETCGLEIATFDRYLGSCISPSNATPYYYDACNDMWNSRNAYDVDFSDLMIDESSFPNYHSDEEWIIFHGNIQVLERMKEYIIEFIPACDNYRTVLTDFIDGDSITGELGNAIRSYLTRVHIELIDCINLVAEQLKNAINQYCIQYHCDFPENDYLLNRSELEDDAIALESLAFRYGCKINEVRSTISAARSELGGSGISYPYNPISVSSRQPDVFESKLNVAINRIREVIRIVDENEERGRYLADDAEYDIIRLNATIEYILPIGGHRVLHYWNETEATDLLDVPDTSDDLLTIEREEPVYNTDAEYYLSSVRDADATNLSDAINDTRMYFNQFVPEGIELSDEMITNGTEYYYHLIDEGWNSEQALAITIYAMTAYSDYLIAGDYSELDNNAATTCPAPSVVTRNASNEIMHIANDLEHGYDQDTRETGPDYDCSSLVMMVYTHAGVPGLYYETEYGIHYYSTTDIRDHILDRGFSLEYDAGDFTGRRSETPMSMSDLEPGDILYRDGHVGMYVGNGYAVFASENEDHLFHASIDGDGTQEETYPAGLPSPDLNDPSTLDTNGEIKFDWIDDNNDGYLDSQWSVLRYTGA